MAIFITNHHFPSRPSLRAARGPTQQRQDSAGGPAGQDLGLPVREGVLARGHGRLHRDGQVSADSEGEWWNGSKILCL